jgi:DNA-binding MarR family transcriptional regulator
MNVIFFGLKRAFHGTLRVTRRALASLGLTAARFDLLYILAKEGGILGQRELQRALGVAASTVSRMLASLEDLGLVTRDAMEEDLRRRWVELTKAGRRCVFRAAELLVHTGTVQLTVDSALSPDQWHNPTVCREANAQFDRSLRLLRHAFRDLATLEYPYAHDDDEESERHDDRARAWRVDGGTATVTSAGSR